MTELSDDFGDALANAAEKAAFGAVGENAAEHLEDNARWYRGNRAGWGGQHEKRKLGERVERGQDAENWRAPFDTRFAGLAR